MVRPAAIEDAAGIARVHVESWQTTYKGIIADDYLASLSIAQRTHDRELRLQLPPPGVVTYVAEANGEVVGFATGGRERSNHPEYTGEIYALYLLAAHQKRGTGRKLVQVVARDLAVQGHTSLLILVLEANPARRFYERLGGRVVLETTFMIGEQVLAELGYGWPDIHTLL
ncbi:MAG: GNAT family N-acetyltransferase [Anaerolineae bacterium]|nr:GNAT family N-acetyltransferase [Anaerolineae bacterium]